jgi:hypothetical protein
VLVILGDRHHLDGFDGDWKLGDHLTEFVDDLSHGVSGCG